MVEFLVVFFLMGGGWLLVFLFGAFWKGKEQRDHQAWVQKGAEHYSYCYDYTEVIKKILHVYNLKMISICENTRIETFVLYIFLNPDGNLSYSSTSPIGYDDNYITYKGTVLIDYNKDNIKIENRVGYMKALADKLKHELNYKVDVFCNADASYSNNNNTYIYLKQKNPSYIPPRTI